MEAQDKPIDEIPAPEVIVALVDLARLSHRAELAIGDAPGTIAALLLERLLTLCGAERGAVLFTVQGGDKPRSYGREAFRTFALHGMNEEEARALIATFSAGDADIQSPPGEPCWVICRLPISVPPVQQQDNRAEQSVAGQLGPLFFPVYALLVLGWEGNDESACMVASKKGQTVLPLVADVAGSAMMNILLVEQIYELGTLADRKALREMELLKAELLATVSHELRSPLASIKGYAATLLRHERRISREERHEFLLAITQASDRLEAVIDRLLEISQLETGGIRIERSPVDLAYLVREAITAVERRLETSEQKAGAPNTQCRFTFTLHLQDLLGMPIRDESIIQADRSRLREVLDHLLENAITYSPEGGAIDVVIRPLVASGQAGRSRTVVDNSDHDTKADMPPSVSGSRQMVEICVRDHGIGIPPAHLERIFDRFHRVDTRLTREVNGLGLGLAICKRIVELHGGVIWAESEVGKGSAFHVWLPMDGRTLPRGLYTKRRVHNASKENDDPDC